MFRARRRGGEEGGGGKGRETRERREEKGEGGKGRGGAAAGSAVLEWLLKVEHAATGSAKKIDAKIMIN